MIRSGEAITFNFEGEKYTLLGNNLVSDIEIISYPISSTESIITVWTLINNYREIIVITGATIIALIGSALLVYLLKEKCFNVNNNNS